MFDNKITDAVQCQTAYELDTSYQDAQLIYGFTLLASGNKTLSDQILSGIPEKTIIFDNRYISVLLSLKEYDQIIAVVKRRIELDPTNPQHLITYSCRISPGRRQS